MATKKEPSNESKASINFNPSDYTRNSRRIADVTDKWVGKAPKDIKEGLTNKDLTLVKSKDLNGKELTVIGYQERKGEVRNKPTEYLLALVIIGDDLCILSTGAAVVCRKIKEAGMANALPITGKIIECQSDDQTYYDFV